MIINLNLNLNLFNFFRGDMPLKPLEIDSTSRSAGTDGVISDQTPMLDVCCKSLQSSVSLSLYLHVKYLQRSIKYTRIRDNLNLKVTIKPRGQMDHLPVAYKTLDRRSIVLRVAVMCTYFMPVRARVSLNGAIYLLVRETIYRGRLYGKLA